VNTPSTHSTTHSGTHTTNIIPLQSCGGTLNDSFIVNLLLNFFVKHFFEKICYNCYYTLLDFIFLVMPNINRSFLALKVSLTFVMKVS